MKHTLVEEKFHFGKEKGVEEDYINLFGCEASSFPFKYFGIPIRQCKLKNTERKAIEGHFETKLASWVGKLHSYGDWPVLINSV
jgi:hypothetical protein